MPKSKAGTGKPRGKCYVCSNIELRDIVNVRMGEGASMSGIWREVKEQGFDCGYASVRVHFGHTSLPQQAVAIARRDGVTEKKDLAVVVRDRTLEAVESGELTPLDDLWKNVNPGLKAQALLDQREMHTDNKKTAIAIAVLMSGSPLAGLPEMPARLLLGDGEDVIEVEAVEVG